MPLYEYRCEDCGRRFTLLVGMTAQAAAQQCPRCRSERLRKLVSRFAVARSEDEQLDRLADMSPDDPEDPRAMADWMRRVGREMGDDLGDDFDDLVEEAVREEVDGPSDSSAEPDSAPGGSPAGVADEG